MRRASVSAPTTQAVAAKVDALASGGMDDFEIPAFLRKRWTDYAFA
jgi:cell division protein FtsZ